MATSPTVLANGPSSAAPAGAPAEAAKFPVVPLLITVVVSVVIAVLGVGGGLFYLARTGRLPLSGVVRKPEAVAVAATHELVLDPMLVNLADQGGSSYLRVSLTLQVADAAGKKASAAKDEKSKDGAPMVAPVRDTLLTVLGRQSSDDLLAVDGKERLKAALMAALAEHNSDLKVSNVYFTDFLVQR